MTRNVTAYAYVTDRTHFTAALITRNVTAYAYVTDRTHFTAALITDQSRGISEQDHPLFNAIEESKPPSIQPPNIDTGNVVT